MRFYTQQHQFSCGIDLHTKKRSLCIIDRTGEIVLHRNITTERDVFLKTSAPFREDMVVAVACLFPWYWIADRCTQEGIPFVLGHALYMKAIHGGKTKNDQIDSHQIAVLLSGGMLPMASVYPAHRRATRDLLRRRNPLMSKRAELSAPIPNTRSQYHRSDFLGRIAKPQNRAGIVDRFAEPSVPKMIATDLAVREASDPIRATMERDSIRMADQHAPVAYALRTSIPASEDSWAWSSAPRSETSAASLPGRTASLTAGWSRVPRNLTAKHTAPTASRSVTPISSGP